MTFSGQNPLRHGRGFAISLIAGLCIGCAVNSVPIRYLQLSDGNPEPAQTDTPLIVMDAVVLPDFLLRDELLLRDSDYLLRYDANRRWSEPLDLGVQRVIASRLEQELNTRQVTRFPEVPRGAPDWRLRIEIQNFEAVGNEVMLRAEGRWGHTSDATTVTAVVQFDERVTLTTVSDTNIAHRMSELLWKFSTALAQSLRSSST